MHHQLDHMCNHLNMANLQRHMVNLALLRDKHHSTMQRNRLALEVPILVLDHTSRRLPMVHLRLHTSATHLQRSQCRASSQVNP